MTVWAARTLGGCFALVLCGGGCSSAGAGSAAASDAGGCPSMPVSFQGDVIPVFAASCTATTACHGQVGNTGEEDLYLGLNSIDGVDGPSTVLAVYQGLVGAKSIEDPLMNLVTPGSLEQSYLWHKLSGDQNSDPTVVNGCLSLDGGNACSDCFAGVPCGAQMPVGSTLEPADTCVVENWILQGAKNN